MLRGEPTIIEEKDGIVYARWGSEYLTGIRDIKGKVREVHFYNAVYDKDAQKKALEDYHKRLGEESFIIL